MSNPIYFSTLAHPRLSPKALRKDLLREKILEVVLGIFTFGIYTACRYITYKKIVPLIFMPSIRGKNQLNAIPDDLEDPLFQKIKVQTLDGVEIDGAALELNPSSKKWMIAFCPNGASYEDVLWTQTDLANRIGMNLLVFNYRQVGKSQGTLKKSFDLLLDGSSVIEYLKQCKGVEEKNMLFSGHSMGGGVATQLTKYYKEVALLNNRSYKNIASVPRVKFLKPLVKWMRLELDVLNAWFKVPANRKLIVYHHNDRTIPYHKAGLYYGIKNALKKNADHRVRKHQSKQKRGTIGLADHLKPLRLKLRGGDEGDEHVYPIFGKELDSLVEKMKLII